MIIALVGRARSGKDYLAHHIQKRTGFKSVAFADALKKVCCGITNNTLEELDYLKNNTPEYRKLLQDIGQAARSYDKNVWVNKLINSLDKDENYIITDVRFENEARALREFGDTLFVYVANNSVVKMNDISETELFNIECDVSFDNTGYRGNVDKFINTIIKEVEK